MLKFCFGAFALLIFIFSCGQITENFQENPENKLSAEENFDSSTHNKYPWKVASDPKNALINRIPLPENFTRLSVKKGSFEDWLRHLPLKAENEQVKLYNGSLKYRQDVHFAIADIDAGGKEDLQQCADACMRLRAEYLYSTGNHSSIQFKFTSGHTASWLKWSEGYRPSIKGNNVTWVKSAQPDLSYSNFRKYLQTVFRYCGTYSLNKEMKAVPKDSIKIGDVFIKGGFPGHAVIVVDIAINNNTGEKIFLIAQSYMPAQDIHILKNFNSTAFNPWYSSRFSGSLETPEWTFDENSLKRFIN